MLLPWERAVRLALALVLCPAGPALALPAVEPARGWPDDAVVPLTVERVASLPAAQQAAWRSYLASSAERARALPPVAPGEDAPRGPMATPPRGGRHTKGLAPDGVAAVWYATDDARAIADRVVEWQSSAGAWTKGIDYSRPPGGGEPADVWSRGTFDNEATSAELRFLARVIAANDPERARPWRAAFLRGLAYVFDSQYPNGGFPQVYPLAGSYHDAITYNDSAMVRALEILRDVAARRTGYEFVPDAQRAGAAERLQRGVDCILATQIRTSDGRRTAWCQQHDALTGRPCAARNFEPIAASALESAGICQFLMSLPEATTRAVERTRRRRRVVRTRGSARRRVASPERERQRPPRRTRGGAPVGALLRDRHRQADLRRPRSHDPLQRDRALLRAAPRLSVVRRVAAARRRGTSAAHAADPVADTMSGARS